LQELIKYKTVVVYESVNDSLRFAHAHTTADKANNNNNNNNIIYRTIVCVFKLWYCNREGFKLYVRRIHGQLTAAYLFLPPSLRRDFDGEKLKKKIKK